MSNTFRRLTALVRILHGRFLEMKWKSNRRFFYSLPSSVSLSVHKGTLPKGRLRYLVSRGMQCGVYVKPMHEVDKDPLEVTYFDICRALTRFREMYPETVR